MNVLVQILYHTSEFRKKLIQISFDEKDKKIIYNPIYNLQKLFISYHDLQRREISSILDIKNLRITLSKYFSDLSLRINGDPVEALNYILRAIHLNSVNKN